MGKRKGRKAEGSKTAARALEQLEQLRRKAAAQALRSFEAAKQSRRTEGWLTSGQGPNAEIRPVLSRIIQRHQDLVDSDPWCKRAVEVVVSNWIGDGIMGAPGPGGTKVFGRLWTTWAESTECDFYGQTNFYGLQELWTRTTAVRGSALIRQRIEPRLLALGLPPLQLQVLEPDWLDTSRDDGTGRIMGGKEYDAEGRLVGYWLRKGHPGELSGASSAESFFVPRGEIIHTYEIRRPSQYTGVPLGVTALLRARDLADYQSAELLKQKLAACFAGFRTKQDPGDDPIPATPDPTAAGHGPVETIEPGVIEELAVGESIVFANPPKVEGYGEFTRMELHAIAVAYGITFEALTGILSDVNFSSGRMGWLEFARNVERWRWNITVPQALDPIGRWFINLATISNQVRGPQKLVWTPPRRELVNPKEEIGWMKDAVRSGMMTLSHIQRSFGFVPLELLDEYQADMAELDQRGIILDIDPRADANRQAPAPLGGVAGAS